MSDRRAMIQADHPLAVTRRCALLDVARSTVYYRPTGISAEDLALMRRLDEIHLERPFYGSRRLRDELETQGHPVNRKRVQRLVRQMGLCALYPKPRTSQPAVGHTVYPYLLRGPAARASHWRAQFLAAGQAGLKSRATDARDEDHRRLQAKIGELLMETELLYAKVDQLEASGPLARRRSTR